MSPRILVTDDAPRRATMAPVPEAGWRLLGALGLVFAVVAAFDIVLAWIPANFADAEWRFGTATTSLDNLPLLAMGLMLCLGAAMAGGRRWATRTVGLVVLALALVVVGWGVMLAGTIDQARAQVTGAIAAGLDRAILKASVQAIVYPLAFGWVGVKSWRFAGSA